MGRFYEHHSEPLTSPPAFLRRVVRHVGLGAIIILGSLVGGMLGFMALERLAAHEAFLNAAMMLSGQEPPHAPTSVACTLFAGAYALYAALVFLVASGILAAPVVHRLLHAFFKGKGP